MEVALFLYAHLFISVMRDGSKRSLGLLWNITPLYYPAVYFSISLKVLSLIYVIYLTFPIFK